MHCCIGAIAVVMHFQRDLDTLWVRRSYTVPPATCFPFNSNYTYTRFHDITAAASVLGRRVLDVIMPYDSTLLQHSSFAKGQRVKGMRNFHFSGKRLSLCNAFDLEANSPVWYSRNVPASSFSILIIYEHGFIG